MIFTVEWATFHTRYLNQNSVFIKESADFYNIYTLDGYAVVKCIVPKKGKAENAMFIERYFEGKTNIIKVIDVDESLPVSETASDSLSEASVRLEDVEDIPEEIIELATEEPTSATEEEVIVDTDEFRDDAHATNITKQRENL